MRKFIAVLLIILLPVTVCAGGTIGGFGAKKISFHYSGDSIAAGYVTITPALELMLEQHYNSSEYTYTNGAVAGYKAEQTAAEVVAYVLANEVDFQFVLCGTNDINFDNDSFTDEQTHFDQMKAACDAAGTLLCVAEVLPRTTWTTTNNSMTITSWNSELAIWCAANDVVLLQIHDDTYTFQDGRHPTEEDSKKIANHFWECIKPRRYYETTCSLSGYIFVTYNGSYILYDGGVVIYEN